MVIQILYWINALDSGGIHFGRLMLMLISVDSAHCVVMSKLLPWISGKGINIVNGIHFDHN